MDTVALAKVVIRGNH